MLFRIMDKYFSFIYIWIDILKESHEKIIPQKDFYIFTKNSEKSAYLNGIMSCKSHFENDRKCWCDVLEYQPRFKMPYIFAVNIQSNISDLFLTPLLFQINYQFDFCLFDVFLTRVLMIVHGSLNNL